MGQKYKVFSEKALIHITDSPKSNIHFMDVNKIENFKAFEKLTFNGTIQIVSKHPETLFHKLFCDFKLIQAAGGIVTCGDSVLMIKRFGFWDLPKGKLENKEEIQEAALREVQEECGIKNGLQLIKEMGCTYHVYEYKKTSILKKTHWFHMTAPMTEKLIPQLDEDISECRWISKNELSTYTKQAYPLIKDLLFEFYNHK